MIHLNFKTLVFTLIITFCNLNLISQSVGISDDGSTPNASAMLDIKSIDKGLLIPRVDTSAITSPATGLMLFQPSDNRFYYYNGTTWITFNGRLFDADNDTGIDVEQSTDEDKIRMLVKGTELLRLERNSNNIGRIEMQGFFNKDNVFIGNNAGLNTGQDSTFVNSGKFNTAVGSKTMQSNTNGVANSALGNFALSENTTGNSNTAAGWNSLGKNISGSNNTAYGSGSLDANKTGSDHTAVGLNALGSNFHGSNTVAIGYRSGVFDTASIDNVYLGSSAGAGGPTTAFQHGKSGNLMAGFNSGENNQGDYNVFLGYRSGQDQTGNNKLIIENSDADSTDALIYGEFDNDILRLNGTVHIKESWSDLDGDTKLKLEETPDDDKIRMIVKGNEVLSVERNTTNVGRIHIDGFSNKNNTFIGNFAGFDTGKDSTFVNSGKFNTAVGDNAMRFNRNGVSNTALGSFALYGNKTGSNNTAIGWNSLGTNISGTNNTALGQGSLDGNKTGSNNTAVGLNALGSNSSGATSVGLGYRAGVFDTASLHNVFIGGNAGAGGPTSSFLHKKSFNVMIGYNAGEDAQGDGNIFLGYESGQNETGDNKLYIENSNADETDALISGDFNTNSLRFNGNLFIDGTGMTNPDKMLHVTDDIIADYVARIDNQSLDTKSYGLEIELGPNSKPETTNIYISFKDGDGSEIGAITGDNSGSVLYAFTSDKRLKQNINPYKKGIELIKKIEAYSYEMKVNPGTEHIGFLAQEIYEIMPQIVKGTPTTTDVENPMMIDYSKMVPVILAATKELITENEILKSKVSELEKVQNEQEALKNQVNEQQALLEELKQMIKSK